jgi:hypothetical protein
MANAKDVEIDEADLRTDGDAWLRRKPVNECDIVMADYWRDGALWLD